jgi:hypothetical protein
MAPPLEPAPDDGMLVRYLLGASPDDETERLDELSVTDDEFAVRLSALEDDLVDAYVSGELRDDELARFRSHYLAAPANRAKVAFAESLTAYSRLRAARDNVDSPSGRGAGRPPSVAIASAAAKWMLAAAALLLLAVGYLLVENLRLRREVSDVRSAHAALADRQRQLQSQLNEQRAASTDATGELARVRQALAELERRSTAAAATRSGVLAVMLAPATRGAERITTIAIPPQIGTVMLRVQLDASDFPRYRATLKDAATERTVWRSALLRHTSTAGPPSVAVALAVGVLESRLYTLVVAGVPARGDEEVVGSYPFRIMLQ